jgi:N-acetyl-gamma-glutamyl-phosphate reductase
MMQVYASLPYTHAMPERISAAVIGANGYAGATAVQILLRHPQVEVVRATSRSFAGQPLSAAIPGIDCDLQLWGEPDPGDAEIVVVALPHGMAAHLAGKWRRSGRTIIDLGADFRLKDAAAYKRWYGSEHPDPALLGEAVFGLPEIAEGDLEGATLVACPGCYSTAALLALYPAVTSGLARPDFIVDAASGVSGAGRSLGLAYHFAETAEDYKAYGVGGHRHLPEIEQGLAFGGTPPRVTFVPHLAPMVRGILATCYFDLIRDSDIGALRAAYAETYEDSPFVRIVDAPPHTKEVLGTNLCFIHVTEQPAAHHGPRAIVIAAIDNLMKGAAGQGVQVLNLARGWSETTGLDLAPQWP